MEPVGVPRKAADLNERDRALLQSASLHLQGNVVVARGTIGIDDALFIAEQVRAGRIKDTSHAVARGLSLLRRVMERAIEAERTELEREFDL